MMSSLWIVLISTAIFVLPGYAVLALFSPQSKFEFTDRICISIGLSIAIVPLTLYWATLLGIRHTTITVSLLLALAAGVSAWDIAKRHRLRELLSSRTQLLTILLLFTIFVVALIARIWGVDGIDFPLWTDSYHHTLISQIIVDSGFVPSSYEPYAPIHDFSYHFGFHTLVAWFNLLTGIPIPRSVVIIGQVVNALVVPTTYVLAKMLWKQERIGIIAALIIGLLSHMPAFFVNWGRYTQLTGQILLPVTIAIFLYSLEQKMVALRTAILSGFSLAGLFLTHNRMTIFALVLCGTFVVFMIVSQRGNKSKVRDILVTTSIFLVVAALLDLGWILNFIKVFWNRIAGMVQAGSSEADFGSYFEFLPSYFTDYGAHIVLWALAALGLIWGVVKRDRGVVWILTGSGIIFLLALSYQIGLPGLYSVLIVIIWLNLPIALLAAYFIDQLHLFLLSFFPPAIPRLHVFRITVFIALVLAAILGCTSIRDLTLPENGFVRGADLHAMKWIEENTRENALFYISTRFWTPHLAHGLDGGYWIPYFTGRPTTMPPQTYASDAEPTYMNNINARAHALTNASSLENLHDLLITYGVDYIYIGKRKAELDPNTFLSAPGLFTPLYRRDGVWIFQVIENRQTSNDKLELTPEPDGFLKLGYSINVG